MSRADGPVVCGVDGSEQSHAAAAIAAELASALDRRLVLVTVVPEVSRAGSLAVAGGGERLAEEEERVGDELLEGVAGGLGEVAAERHVEFGDTAERLAAYAESEGASLLVLGARGRGAVKAAVLGSVSQDVIGRARCPVVVVP